MRICRFIIRMSVLFVLLFRLVSLSEAATWYVATNGLDSAAGTSWDTALLTITNAHTKAAVNGGDLILVSNGTYVLTATITITKRLDVKSLYGAEQTVVDGNLASQCFNLKGTGVVDGFTITKGAGGGVWGAGVRFEKGSNIVQNCIIVSNSGDLGGGVYNQAGYGMLKNCIIRGNTATNVDGKGGGVYAKSGLTILNCRIENNSALVSGGGVTLYGATMRNCLLVSNTAADGGGVTVLGYGKMENCTLVSNTATSSGGGSFSSYGYGTFINSILYFNSAGTAGRSNYYFQGSGYVAVTNSCLAPLYTGSNNISANPQFIDWTSGNYHLDRNSPCVNAGVNRDWMVGTMDLDGHHRLDVFSGIVDIGCYEYVFRGTMVIVH